MSTMVRKAKWAAVTHDLNNVVLAGPVTYKVQIKEGATVKGEMDNVAALEADIDAVAPGLVNNQSYTVSVTAKDPTAGESAPAALSFVHAALPKPKAPTGLIVENTQIP